jgi:hypothetical protein
MDDDRREFLKQLALLAGLLGIPFDEAVLMAAPLAKPLIPLKSVEITNRDDAAGDITYELVGADGKKTIFSSHNTKTEAADGTIVTTLQIYIQKFGTAGQSIGTDNFSIVTTAKPATGGNYEVSSIVVSSKGKTKLGPMLAPKGIQTTTENEALLKFFKSRVPVEEAP